jgi:hypothetical protein
MDQIAMNYINNFSIANHFFIANIYSKWDFWFENMPSYNPDKELTFANQVEQHDGLDAKRRVFVVQARELLRQINQLIRREKVEARVALAQFGHVLRPFDQGSLKIKSFFTKYFYKKRSFPQAESFMSSS